jgi:hypothetical protein
VLRQLLRQLEATLEEAERMRLRVSAQLEELRRIPQQVAPARRRPSRKRR